MKPRMPLNHRVLVVAVAGLLAADFTRGTGDLAKSEAAAQEAKKQELAANEIYDSHQMAHAATREIARSERVRAEAALKNLRAAEAALKHAVATGKPAADLAELHKAVEDRTVTLRAAADRMVSDSLASSKASAEVIAAEQVIRDKLAEVRKVEQDMLEMKAQAAENAKAPDADAARRAVLVLEAQKALETQQWPNVRKDIVRELVEQTGEAARVARALAAADTDAARKQKLEQFADQQAKAKSAAEKLLADTLAEMEAATPKIYPLRMAAMGGLKLLPPEKWDYAKARHLLVRAGFGGTPQEVEKLHKMGLYKAVDHLVEFYRQPAPASALDPVPPTQMDNVEARLTLRFFSSRVAAERQSVERGIITRVRQSWLQRMVESPRPLQEKLALFWHGHFANQSSVVDNGYIMYRQNQFFREHAAANFGGLLYGIVHDPAMIRYLDNNKNVKGDPNENLAREIMELFAMGVDQGYTEKDIIQAARALTGYTYDDHTGGFRYDHTKHDTGDKTIFGQTGNWTGDDVVRLILEQPATARYISRKLFEYFAFLDPSPETVERLASVLRSRNYELDPLLKNLFLSEEFYSERAQATQIKSPAQLVVGTLRDLGVKEVSSYGAIDSAIQQMGQQLFEPPDVKGWRYGRSWISSNRLFVRYNSVADLIKSVPQGRKLGAGVDVVALLEGGGCPTGCDAVDYLARACLMRPLTEAKRKELTDYLGELPPSAEWTKQRAQLNEKLRGLMVLMLSTPEYQLM